MLVACGNAAEPPPPPPIPRPAPVPADAALPPSDRVACDQEGPITLDHKVLECRELPFDLELLEPGFLRADATTITTIGKSFPDGSVWLAEIQPMLEDVTMAMLETRMRGVAQAIDPKVTLAGEMHGMNGNGGLMRELAFTTPSGREIDVHGWFFRGYLATLTASAPANAETSASKLRGHNFVEALKPKGPPAEGYVPLALAAGSVEIPARAWRYTQMKPVADVELRTHLFALPDLAATLGVRELAHPERCAQLAATEPAAFIASLELGSLTIDTVTRVTHGLHVITKDARPAAYYLLCRDGLFVQLVVRGTKLDPALLAILDHAAESLRGAP